MSTKKNLAALVTALLLGAALGGCGRAPQPENVPPPPAPANEPMPAPPADPGAPPADGAPTAPAQPAPTAPSPQDSSPVPTPTSNEPALGGMKVARASAKMSVAVDLRYQIDAAAPGRPVTLHLAAVPRVEATRFDLKVAPESGIELAPGALTLQKSGSENVYRRQYTVTRSPTAPASVDVLVTMDSSAGSGFGYFTVPLDGGSSAQNQHDPVKQR